MLNIAICDDDDLIAHQIESVLHNIGDEENVKIDTDVFYSGNDLVREISSGKKFDLIYGYSDGKWRWNHCGEKHS